MILNIGDTKTRLLLGLAYETNHARTAEFRALWSPLIDHQVGDCLNGASLHNSDTLLQGHKLTLGPL